MEPDYELVGVVDDGTRIIEAAQEFLPDVITLDIGMPGQSGMRALPCLRAMLPKAIIVVVTTISMPIYKETAFDRGADGYIDKASLTCELLPTIASVRNRSSESGQSPL